MLNLRALISLGLTSWDLILKNDWWGLLAAYCFILETSRFDWLCWKFRSQGMSSVQQLLWSPQVEPFSNREQLTGWMEELYLMDLSKPGEAFMPKEITKKESVSFLIVAHYHTINMLCKLEVLRLYILLISFWFIGCYVSTKTPPDPASSEA